MRKRTYWEAWPTPCHHISSRVEPALSHFHDRFARLPGERVAPPNYDAPQRAPLPLQPEPDLLWFIAQYTPDMADWEQDIFLAVREEAYYFHPIPSTPARS